LFSFTALVPWTFFVMAVQQSSNSVVGSANLISKVYFPRLAIPVATVLAAMVDFGISFVVLLGMMIYYRRMPTVHALYVPFFVLLAFLASLGVGLWLSALNVKYRDIRYVVPFLLQFWMFASPIVYPTSMLPARWRTLYALNPMVGVVDGMRWSLLGTHTAPGPVIAVSAVTTLLFALGGAMYFRKMENRFADIV
jgi:lipopolysaccharide transport system permease protein